MIWPTAWTFYDSRSIQADYAAASAVCFQGHSPDGTHYSPAMMDATCDEFMILARRTALVTTIGHGASDQVSVGSTDQSIVCVQDIISTLNGLGDTPILLALHLNCSAAPFADKMQAECGADCAIGWDEDTGCIPIAGADDFSYHFWHELCDNGASVGGAAIIAAEQAYWHSFHDSWFNYHIFGALSGGAGLWPARYGD